MNTPKRFKFFDTVEVKLPASIGTELALFRDLTDKGNALTNFSASRRLPSWISSFELNRIEVEPHHWSGDNMRDLFWALCDFTLRVNNRRIVQENVREDFSFSPVKIMNNDDIDGKISIGRTPWNAPELKEWTQQVRHITRTLSVPKPLQWIADAFPLRITHSEPTLVPRPREGSLIVRMTLIGSGVEVIGK